MAVMAPKKKQMFISCPVEGCERTANPKSGGRKGFCWPHYLEKRDAGEIDRRFKTEEWIQGHKDYSGDDCLIWPFCRNTHGYGQIRRNNKGHMVNRIMCVIAHGEPPSPKMHAAHSCGNGHLGCVNPKHLSWKTASENAMDKVIHGTDNRGAKCHKTKLTREAVIDIKLSDQTQASLARKYGVTHSTIWNILSGQNWAHVHVDKAHRNCIRDYQCGDVAN